MARPLPPISSQAMPRRWPWLLLTLILGVLTIGTLAVLDRQRQDALDSAHQAGLLVAEVRQAASDGEAVKAVSPSLHVITPIIVNAVEGGTPRLPKLAKVEPVRAARMQADATRLVVLARTSQGRPEALPRIQALVDRIVAEATAISRHQQYRADRIRRDTLIGGAAVLLIALCGVGFIATRAQRTVVVATRRHAAEMRALAESDPLTGLANRHRLELDLERLAAEVDEDGTLEVEIAICDLDGFKGVNDRYGHEEGDRLLAEVARRLDAAVGPTGTVYRLGGDEFCIVSRPGAEIGRALHAVLDGETIAGHAEIRGSLGVARWPGECTSAREAMRLADQRMYAEKAPGGHTV